MARIHAEHVRTSNRLLRQVDEQLLHFGPRRASERLSQIRRRMPYNTAGRWQKYYSFLQEMIKRREASAEEFETMESQMEMELQIEEEVDEPDEFGKD